MAFSSLQPLDGFLQRGPIGERAAQPAVVRVVHSAALRFLGDGFLRLALGPHKQNRAALRGDFHHEARGFAEHLQSLLQIDNVNAIALPEDIFLHFRVPTARLVAEVNAGLQ